MLRRKSASDFVCPDGRAPSQPRVRRVIIYNVKESDGCPLSDRRYQPRARDESWAVVECPSRKGTVTTLPPADSTISRPTIRSMV